MTKYILKTLKEAKDHLYGTYAFGYKSYNPERCATIMADSLTQCENKPGYGPDKMYCRLCAKSLSRIKMIRRK